MDKDNHPPSRQSLKTALLGQLKQAGAALSLPEIYQMIDGAVAERTLRRWLVAWVDEGVLLRTGKKRATRYQFHSSDADSDAQLPGFLAALSAARREAVQEQLRNLWTHSSTALEGNTLTLGDTHDILSYGVTIKGKPLREHQEVVGHARAIDLLYQALGRPLDKSLLFDLHKAVQTDVVHDIYKPVGDWKREINGTNAINAAGEQCFIEYTNPLHVDALMSLLIEEINRIKPDTLDLANAAHHYARIHMALVHIHPFWDGNGRIARLLANLPLLKAGLPPLLIDQKQRRDYIYCLSAYQIAVGKLTPQRGLWPEPERLADFTAFCETAYRQTRELLEKGQTS